MADQLQTDILRRMVRPGKEDVVESPLTSSRAVRMALTKVAQDSVGLSLAVKAIADAVQPLDDMLTGLVDDLMLITLQRGAGPVGLIAIDVQMRSAILEMRTVGMVADKPVDSRPPTGTDKRMCDPFVAGLMHALPQAVVGTEFEGWLGAAVPAQLVSSVKEARLMLPDRQYRALRLSVILGNEEREGEIVLCLPLSAAPEAPVMPDQSRVDWDTEFHEAVSDAPLTLDAELHRFSLPLHHAHNLQIGEVLPLPGCTVGSVKLRALDGHVVRQAKLGQSGGKRAIRIEAAPLPEMSELTPKVGAVPPAKSAPALLDKEPRAPAPVTEE